MIVDRETFVYQIHDEYGIQDVLVKDIDKQMRDLILSHSPTTENLTKTFQKIFNKEGIAEVNYLEALDENKVLFQIGVERSGSNGKLDGSMARIIGRKGVCIRLITFILENYFGIEKPRVIVKEKHLETV